MSALPPNASDAALSREQIMLRELFEDHYKLADRFEAAAQQISVVERSLHGTEGQLGIAELLLDAAEQCRRGAVAVSQLNIGELAATVTQLNEQAKALPRQLLRPEESQAFRESLERALLADATRILRVAYESAMTSGCLEAVENALTEMQKRIDTSSLERCQAAEERSKTFQAELGRTAKELTAARERVKEHNIALNNQRDLLNARFAEHLAAARKWSLAKFATGAILGAVLSILYLAPQIEDFLASEIIYKPIHERR
ncbi:TPA: hypothetical protein L3660_004178 [Pseudomonas aeruginosa]|nr:hypothetical protein [Pseudomonas aeruginosa]